VVTHPLWVHEVPGSKPCPGKGFYVSFSVLLLFLLFMPPPFEEWWRVIKCYPCPSVRLCVGPLSKYGVRLITFERFNSNLVS